MNPNEKELLQKTYELTEENNKILRGIRRSNRWSTLFRVFYWIVIIGISIGAFIYIQPYVDSVMKAYNSIQNDLNTVKSVTNKFQ
jgi:hypothetical protein